MNIRVGVIRGGRSGEHEVSLRSAESILNAIDRNKYDIVPITISHDGKCLDFDLPDGYSPNGDHFNDFYDIHGIERYPDNTFIVFNRWGNEVFNIDNYNNTSHRWDGQNNHGDPLPDGTYYVILVIHSSPYTGEGKGAENRKSHS